MSDAEIILKMIEEVSPDDEAGLYEIDCRVAVFVGHAVGIAHNETGGYNGVTLEDGWSEPPAEYTRSRDAIKAIRPEGWCMPWMEDDGLGTFSFGFYSEGEQCRRITGYGKEEELAELHAVIQAINYERTQK